MSVPLIRPRKIAGDLPRKRRWKCRTRALAMCLPCLGPPSRRTINGRRWKTHAGEKGSGIGGNDIFLILLCARYLPKCKLWEPEDCGIASRETHRAACSRLPRYLTRYRMLRVECGKLNNASLKGAVRGAENVIKRKSSTLACGVFFFSFSFRIISTTKIHVKISTFKSD